MIREEFEDALKLLKNKSAKIVKNNFNSIDLIELKNASRDIIDFLILDNDDIIYYVFKNIKYDISIRIEPTKLLFSNEEIDNLFHVIKRALEKFLFQYANSFNFYIFTEIKHMVRFFIAKNHNDITFRNSEKLYSMDMLEFHEQNSMFKYLFSIFDKFAYIARHLSKKYNPNYEEKTDVRFSSTFVNDVSFLLKSNEAILNLDTTLNKLFKSNSWHFVRKMRNIIEHNFADPSLKYNIQWIIDILFILVARLMMQIIEDFKENDMIIQQLQKSKTNNKEEEQNNGKMTNG
ncbi:hypothetical protein [Spiroplasma endosymbiont of Labia minor]|uniref:hypothetical protein n=1 Tax=Spiroplasma endosymbiont of Labia minor TaxID=3066305 RepID=UPI0030D226E3